MDWDIKYHDEELQAEVLALPAGILARYFHCTDRMLKFGPDLGKRMKEWKNADT